MPVAGRSRDEIVARRASGFSRAPAYVAWSLLYAVFIAYGSLVVGPSGLHFVPLDPADAWQRFQATHFLENGSDQRPDWIANLLFTVPLGFLASGAAASARNAAWQIAGAILALLLCLAFVLAVKYAQLFFPPRTVSLNYIVAQSIGVCIGMTAFPLVHAKMPAFAALNDQTRLKLLLDLSIVGIVAFALFPFDIVLSLDDLRQRLGDLPHSLAALPWPERSPGLRAVLLAATAASTVPLGVRLALRRDHPGLGRITVAGTALMIALLLASALVLSAATSLATLALRVVGLVAGAGALHWLSAHDLQRTRSALARSVPLLVLPYLALLAYVQDLFQPHWQTPDQALAALDPRAVIPFWHYYIVSKAQVAQNIAAHVVMYAPIGVMVWLREGDHRRSGRTAGIIATFAALLVEAARALHPGREPDLEAVIVAALAAVFAARVCPVIWRLLCSVSAVPRVAPQQRPTAAAAELGRAQRAAFEQIAAGHRRSTIKPPGIPLPVRAFVAIACAAGDAMLIARYPLGSWYAAMAVAGWVGLLWWRPALWLVLLPAMIPSADLAPWTGWLMTSEADMAVLATVGVLLLRDPPALVDLWPKEAARVALTLATFACLVGLARGMLSPYAIPGGSDNPYLQPWNALRGAKPFIETLALLPFLLARQRAHGDTIARFGCGMLIGLAMVGIAAILERAAFVGVFDAHTDYRVVATFSSMHIGGGHIGAFVALALPFLVVCLNRPNAWTLPALTAVVALGGYALVVTFARTAYAAAVVATAATAFAWATAQYRQGRRFAAAAGALLPAVMLIVVMSGLLTPYMASRLGETARDLVTRESNWSEGFALDQEDTLSLLLGMGTGTYPRVAALNPLAEETSGNYLVVHDAKQSYLTLRSGGEFYFGQKVPLAAGTKYSLALEARALPPGGTLRVGICAKLLLYSVDCHATTFEVGPGWAPLKAVIAAPETSGPVPAPTELWLATDSGSPVDVSNIQLVGPDDRNVVANGNFASGTTRWLFTSDLHLAWRIKNLYLATWFDGGVLGLLALVVIVATAMTEASRVVIIGNRWGAPIIGGLVALLISGVFDDVLEAPRLALLYDLVIVLGLIAGERVRSVPRVMVTTAA